MYEKQSLKIKTLHVFSFIGASHSNVFFEQLHSFLHWYINTSCCNDTCTQPWHISYTSNQFYTSMIMVFSPMCVEMDIKCWNYYKSFATVCALLLHLHIGSCLRCLWSEKVLPQKLQKFSIYLFFFLVCAIRCLTSPLFYGKVVSQWLHW